MRAYVYDMDPAVMEDMERSIPGAFGQAGEKVNGAPQTVELVLKDEQHNAPTPDHVHEESKVLELKRETSGDLATDNDTFHSVPTTPMETISLADGK